jgi:hypothetical protein
MTGAFLLNLRCCRLWTIPIWVVAVVNLGCIRSVCTSFEIKEQVTI